MRKLLPIALLMALLLPAQDFIPILRHRAAAASTPVSWTAKTCVAGFSSGSSSSETCTWSAALAAGDTAICRVDTDSSGKTFSVTDSASNAYAAFGTQFGQANPANYTQLFYKTVTGAVTTTTFNLNAASTWPGLLCVAARGVAASPEDGAANADATGYLATAGPITTTANGAGIVCAGHASGGTNLSVGSGFSVGVNPYVQMLVETQVQATAGSISPTMVTDVYNNLGMQCAAFKP